MSEGKKAIDAMLKVMEPYIDVVKTEKEWIDIIKSSYFQSKFKEEMANER